MRLWRCVIFVFLQLAFCYLLFYQKCIVEPNGWFSWRCRALMERPNLSRKENLGLVEEDEGAVRSNLLLCLVGSLLINNYFNVEAFTRTIGMIRRLIHGVHIQMIRENIFVFYSSFLEIWSNCYWINLGCSAIVF